MSAVHALVIFAAGIAAGTINTVVGSGTLITFPVLLAFGYAPVTANVSNTVGLVPGSVAGAIGYRRELDGQRARTIPLAVASVLGGLCGAVLLLTLPASAFKAIVPVFIAIALVLILAQPRLNRVVSHHRERAHARAGPAATAAIFGSGVYGGYFGAAQGILVLAILGLSVNDELQRMNALKVVLTGLVNLVAAIVFVIRRPHRVARVAADRGRRHTGRVPRRPGRPPAARAGAEGRDRGRGHLRDREVAVMTVVLRPLVVEDEPELIRIHRTPDVERWWDVPADGFPWDEPESVRLTIEVDGAVAGLIQFWEENEPRYRYAAIDLFLDPALHGRGIGTEALRLLVRDLIEERGHHRLTIDPAADNVAAIRSYEKVGFRRVGVMRAYERDAGGTGWHDGLLMELVVAR